MGVKIKGGTGFIAKSSNLEIVSMQDRLIDKLGYIDNPQVNILKLDILLTKYFSAISDNPKLTLDINKFLKNKIQQLNSNPNNVVESISSLLTEIHSRSKGKLKDFNTTNINQILSHENMVEIANSRTTRDYHSPENTSITLMDNTYGDITSISMMLENNHTFRETCEALLDLYHATDSDEKINILFNSEGVTEKFKLYAKINHLDIDKFSFTQTEGNQWLRDGSLMNNHNNVTKREDSYYGALNSANGSSDDIASVLGTSTLYMKQGLSFQGGNIRVAGDNVFIGEDEIIRSMYDEYSLAYISDSGKVYKNANSKSKEEATPIRTREEAIELIKATFSGGDRNVIFLPNSKTLFHIDFSIRPIGNNKILLTKDVLNPENDDILNKIRAILEAQGLEVIEVPSTIGNNIYMPYTNAIMTNDTKTVLMPKYTNSGDPDHFKSELNISEEEKQVIIDNGNGKYIEEKDGKTYVNLEQMNKDATIAYEQAGIEVKPIRISLSISSAEGSLNCLTQTNRDSHSYTVSELSQQKQDKITNNNFKSSPSF